MHKVQTNNFRHRAKSAVPKMATHRIAHHLPQFLNGLTLGGDGVPECGGDIPAVHLVLAHLKDDLGLGWTISRT